jgi:hypothetical protein
VQNTTELVEKQRREARRIELTTEGLPGQGVLRGGAAQRQQQKEQGELRREHARLLLHIADRHWQRLQKRWLRALHRQIREAEDNDGKRRGDEASGAMRFRRQRLFFKDHVRETENGDAADEHELCGEGGRREKVAVAPGRGTGKLIRKLKLFRTRPNNGQKIILGFLA